MTRLVEALLVSGRLERIAVDRSAASLRLAKAEQHLATAQMLLGQDNEVAYTALYDAARKAATAHMLARGIRASTSKPGAHEAVGIYLAEMVPDPTGSVRKFQRIRSKRNGTEYRDLIVGDQEIASDLVHATNIVAAVRADLGS
jgi:HEPN domain